MTNNDGQRIAVLETKIEHLSQQLAETNSMVTEMRDVLLQAKGAKWVFMGGVAIVGFFTSLLTHILPFKSLFK
jgi:Tfp pilus assembly protein PilN